MKLDRLEIRVAALAAATLLLEGALLRLLAVAQFYRFAFLVVSLALLGFGASGTLLSLFPQLRTRTQPEGSLRLLTATGSAFAVSVAVVYGVVNLLPFDSYSIAWERKQILYFALYYLALTIPFLVSGLGIGATVAASQARSHIVYGANLIGAGVGALLGLGALWLAGVPGALVASATLGLLAALAPGVRRVILGLIVVGSVSFLVLTALNFSGAAPLGITLSPYKGLAQTLRYPGSAVIYARWNAFSRVDVVADAGTRQLPGLSYTYPDTPPPQQGLVLDAGDLKPITLAPPEGFAAAAYLPEAIAFHLRPQAHVLVLEPGGGLGVLQALASGAEQITAVIDNPGERQAVAHSAPAFDLYRLPQVQIVFETGRVFAQRDRHHYSIVFIPLTDAYQPVTSGAYSLAESYDLTVEAFTAALDRLEPAGVLVITRWLQMPPSECVRTIATIAEALGRRGAPEPAAAIVAYRGVQTITFLVQPAGWQAGELAQVRAFTQARRYDLVWSPDIRAEETNRFNRLRESVYYSVTQQVLTAADRQTFYRSYPFAVAPATDDHPFFFHFFKWGQTPAVLANLGRTWQPFGGSGYFLLLALLALVIVLSLLLILAPLLLPGRSGWRPSRGRAGASRRLRVRVFAYFGCLGLAFLFVEIPLIQRWILLLGHPSYAFTALVLILLVLSGLGSFLARAAWLPKRAAFGLLVLLAVLTPFLTAWLLRSTLGWPLPLRMGSAALGLVPLAVLMGLPFSLGLAWLEEAAPALVPWGWAINGCASVVAGVLAAILSLSYGFTLVLLLGAAGYAGAWVMLFWPTRQFK